MHNEPDAWNSRPALPACPMLVIDTATRPGFVGVWQHRVWRARESFPDARRQGEEIFPAISRVLMMSGLGLEAVAGIVTVTGPGSFSSLRVGLSAAKSLSETRGLPLVGVPLLDAAARTMPGVSRGVLTAASRNQVFLAIYDESDRLAAGPLVTHPEELPMLAGIRPEQWIGIGLRAAEALASLGELAPASLAVVADEAIPALIAEEGWRRHSTGLMDDPILLDALYVRQQDADGSWTDARMGGLKRRP